MPRYIDADALIRLIEIDAICYKPYSRRDAIACIKAINTADVVPKSEFESIITLNSQLEAQLFERRKEIESLKKSIFPSYSQAISEEAAIKIGKEYGKQEAKEEIEKLNVELKAMRGAANSYKMHYEKAKAEIETLKDNNEHLAVMLEEAKSEVGKLQNGLVIWKQNRFNLFQRLGCYEMTRQKVASEIFANLEKLHLHITNDFDLRRYNELKKKYTEGEDKPASEEKYFSPGDVAKMTHQEVREKYTAIRKSMEMW